LAAPREDSIARGGPRNRASLTPGPARATAAPRTANQVRPAEDAVWETLGLKYNPMPRDEYQRTYAPYLNDYPHGGVVVKAVKEGSALADKGITQGDVIVGIHDWVATSTSDLRFVARVWSNLNTPNGLVRIHLFRDGMPYYTDIPLKK